MVQCMENTEDEVVPLNQVAIVFLKFFLPCELLDCRAKKEFCVSVGVSLQWRVIDGQAGYNIILQSQCCHLEVRSR